MEHGNGNLQNCSYLLNSSPVRLTELYRPSHWYAIVVKFFLELFLLHNALSNKRLCKTVPYLSILKLDSYTRRAQIYAG